MLLMFTLMQIVIESYKMSSENLPEVQENHSHSKDVLYSSIDNLTIEYNPEVESEPVNLVVLMRCGEPNTDQHFCGWYNYELSIEGKQSMREAGILLRNENYVFDHAYCSLSLRCQQSLSVILEELDLQHIPITQSWHLNPRHLGAITGMKKRELIARYGYDQINYWLNSNEYQLPPMAESHQLYDSIYNSERYAEYSNLPLSESFEMVEKRVVKYWNEEIAPKILAKEKILIVSHNRALQSLIQHLDDLDFTQISKDFIPIATPFYYRFDESLKTVQTKYDLLQ